MTIKISQKSRFGEILKDERKNRNLTQSGLAEKLGFTRNTVTRLEKGLGWLETFQAALTMLGYKITARQLPAGEYIGQQVRTLRQRRGISQRQLAALANLSQPTIWRLEKGERSRVKTIENLFIVLGVERRIIPLTEPDKFYTSAATSSAHDGWETPQTLLAPLYQIFQFDLDPCSPTHDAQKAPVRARVYYTSENDGLSLDWFGFVYLNPPYGRDMKLWTAKAKREVQQGQAEAVIALLPARTDTRWWHDDITGSATVWFLKGRLRFGDAENVAPFASALVGWGMDAGQQQAITAAFPESWQS